MCPHSQRATTMFSSTDTLAGALGLASVFAVKRNLSTHAVSQERVWYVRPNDVLTIIELN